MWRLVNNCRLALLKFVSASLNILLYVTILYIPTMQFFFKYKITWMFFSYEGGISAANYKKEIKYVFKKVLQTPALNKSQYQQHWDNINITLVHVWAAQKYNVNIILVHMWAVLKQCQHYIDTRVNIIEKYQDYIGTRVNTIEKLSTLHWYTYEQH